MRVLLTTTSYPADDEDWRGRFIASLTCALTRQNDLSLAVWAPPGKLPEGTTRATSADDAAWLNQLAKKGGIAHLLRTRRLLALGTVTMLLTRLRRAYRQQRADVVHANWLQNAMPLWGIRGPALITVLGSDFGLLRLPGMRTMLRAMLRQRRAILAPNAEWMRADLEAYFGDVAEIRPIPFGVNCEWFEIERRPGKDTRDWLAITRLTANKIGDLFHWGEGLFDDKRQLHLFGPMQERIELPVWVRYHGPTHPAELQQVWFPRAAGLISLSRHDEGRPQVMLEAMAAGLPVIASSIEAHEDLIQDGKTGWLPTNRAAFAAALSMAEGPSEADRVGMAAKEYIRNIIGTWDDCAARYVAAYRDLLQEDFR